MKDIYISSEDINNILGVKLKKLIFTGAAIDSRLVKKNNIFFAIKGKKTDGHKYLDMAFKKGASLAIVEKIQRKLKKPQIKVNNVHKTMIRLAKFHRNNLEGMIIAITGSIGKTGTKDALFNIIPKTYKVFHSRKSFNNHIGLPLEILNMSKNHHYGIFELGMNHKNELSKLTSILQPNIACILNVSYVHGGNFNSIREIAYAKSEILNSSKNMKTVILNQDDKFFSLMKRESKNNYEKKIISFGKSKGSSIRLNNLTKCKGNLKLDVLMYKKQFIKYNLPFTHAHLILNSLAIVSCLDSMNLNVNFIKNYGKTDLTSGRGNLIKTKIKNKNVNILDHSYNASPESFSETIKSFHNYNHKNKIYIIGEMFELGKKSSYYHNALYKLIISLNSKNCFFVGKQFNFIKKSNIKRKYDVFLNTTDLIEKFDYDICYNSIIYIKGSNAVGLNKFISHIKNK